MALWPNLVRVEPSAQTVEVIAERSDLAPLPSLQLSPLHRDVLGSMPLPPLSVCVKPLAQTVEVIAERSDLVALLLLQVQSLR